MRKFVFLSEKGKRNNKEDYYGNYKDEFFLVADGLGGHPAGEIASKMAVGTAIETFKDLKKKGGEIDFSKIFKRADDEILNEAQKISERIGMATTLLVAALINNSIVFANVGDCRAYLFTGSKLEKVTTDDRDSVGHLLRALGAHNEDIEPQIVKKDVKKGNIAFLCSDGLHDFVKDEVIEKILRSEAGLEDKAKGLVEAALQFGSTDNVTVGLISV